MLLCHLSEGFVLFVRGEDRVVTESVSSFWGPYDVSVYTSCEGKGLLCVGVEEDESGFEVGVCCSVFEGIEVLVDFFASFFRGAGLLDPLSGEESWFMS